MKKKRILIADDSDLVREFLRTLLEERGYEVDNAVNGVDAILKVFETKPDLLVLDLEMPVMKGYQASRFLKNHGETAGIPIIMHTTKDEDHSVFWGYSAGADGYVTKDFDNADLLLKEIEKKLRDAETGAFVPKKNTAITRGLFSEEDVLTEVNDLLDRELFSMTVISELNAIARNMKSAPETIERIFSVIGRLIPFEIAGLYLDRKNEGILMTYENGIADEVQKSFIEALRPLIKKAQRSGVNKKIRVNRIRKERGGSPVSGTVRSLWTREITYMTLENSILAFASCVKNAFTEEQLSMLESVYMQAAILINNAMLFNEIRRLEERTRQAFERYVPKEVIQSVLSTSSESLLSGEKRKVTILFSDLRNFTSLSERMSPEMLVNLLNDYFSRMVACITGSRGTIDKFIGDAILAIFGAPNIDPESPESAVSAAFEMMDRIVEYNRENTARGLPELHMGIGMHYGDAIVGNIGSVEKMDYTVIGDTVNLSSRLESLTKYYQVDIIVSDDVMQRVKNENIIFVEIDTVRVKGKEQKTVIYTAYKNESLTPLVRNSIESFKKAYSLYRIGNFFEALDLFNSIDDGFKLKWVYADRCLRFSVSPPENWEGVFDMDTK